MTVTDKEKKNLQMAAAVVAGGVLLYVVFSKKTETTPDPTGNGAYTPINVYNPQKVATALYETMKDMGTDEEAILEILKPINQSQFAQVIQAFGKLNYNTTTGDQRNYNPFAVLPKLGLKDWLKSELSLKEYSVLRLKYPNSL